jgi:hypothetical protein
MITAPERAGRLVNPMRKLAVLFLLMLIGVSPLAAQLNPNEIILFDARNDLEVLADTVYQGTPPADWIGNVDITSPTFVIDLWVDNERLANQIFGAEVRPPDWIGASVADPMVLARNVRHDLEIAADTVFGIGTRPEEWRGGAPLLRCDRELQNIVTLLGRFYSIQIGTPESALNYCATVTAEIEDELIEIAFNRPGSAGVPAQALQLLGAVRGDLERTADEVLGLNTRPEGYRLNRDVNSPTFIPDLFQDLNTLADSLLGVGIRPDGWIGSISPNNFTTYLNLRNDVELLTDATLGERLGFGNRPTGWQGVDPLERCSPSTRALVALVQENYGYDISLFDRSAADFCGQITQGASALVENPPVIDVVESQQEQRFQAESNYAFSYLDLAATQYMGIMPGGVRFRAVYRNFGQSSMMLVASDRFAVWVDYRFTSLPETTFNSLPTWEEASVITFCDDFWCNGPGPTPTPTGFGPLEAVLNQTTPVPTPDPSQLQTTKQLVSWNYIRVTYVQDNLQTRTAQVALEICSQPAQAAEACEPVQSVFDNATGTTRPVLSQFNGLNVYEFQYGYTQNIVVEGATHYSNDIWISDPTIR